MPSFVATRAASRVFFDPLMVMARSGILVLDKPAGITSRRALDAVAKPVRPDRAGHAGTLDPLATGVLVVLVGQATRLTDAVHALSKVYRAEFLLGRSSDTDDIEGVITEYGDDPIPTRAAIDAELPNFLGRIKQRPPAHSAIKIDGQRAYDRARAGEVLTMPERTVVIHEATIDDYQPEESPPRLTMDDPLRYGNLYPARSGEIWRSRWELMR